MFNKKFAFFLFQLVVVGVVAAFAGSTQFSISEDVPDFMTGISNLLELLAGPVPKIIGVVMIIASGITLAFTEGKAVKMILWVLVGIGIAINASSFAGQFIGGATIAMDPSFVRAFIGRV